MKPIELSEGFRTQVRGLSREVRVKVGRALQELERDFGNPHRHHGLGIRKLIGNYFEIRVGLELRLVFENQPESLLFLMAGDHDEVRRFLRGS